MPHGNVKSYSRCGCKLCKKILKAIKERDPQSLIETKVMKIIGN